MIYRKYIFPFCLVIFCSLGCSGGGDDGGGGGSGDSCLNSGGCPAGEFCNFTDLLCGENGKNGRCEAAPAFCDLQIANVCSCQGLTFFNECFSSSAGQAVRSVGDCQ